ncbi:hypothetical protein NAPIS_ORF01077 [Vairimorpha apis BRL 01]|uniref:Uncharacterized protein n=1 Tax=Vairimorpha apis BRL 01 TaxID=1037528 RepID=T0LA60_9MICR|nr:hypothetical protein NAPIS_ORF01077 [Vairimorpha apis BRL 01]
MFTHPIFLRLLTNFKLSNSDEIPIELLYLLVQDKTKIDYSYLYNILFKYKNSTKKHEAIKQISNQIERYFIYNNKYMIKDNIKISSNCIYLHNKVISTKILMDTILNNLSVLKYLKNEKLTNDTQLNIWLKKAERKIKQFKPEKECNNSLLKFVTKKITQENSVLEKNLTPIIYESTVYVYTGNNPNYVSFRRRKDLINPIKKIFIKFSEEIKPPIYEIKTNYNHYKISIARLDLNYDEDSTWEEEKGEDIGSDESEEEDTSNISEEWIDSDSEDEENTTGLKRPILTFPNIKIIKNDLYDEIWKKLSLHKIDIINDKLENKIKQFKNLDIKILSNIFMVKENVLKTIFN